MRSEPYNVLENGVAGRLPEEMVLFTHLSGEAEETESGQDMLIPFAFEEMLCRDVGAGQVPPVLHLWSHPGGVALGLRDSRLPRAGAAMQALEEQGIRTAVRHSGGAAVPLDAGIINVSLLLPKVRASWTFTMISGCWLR